MKTFKAVLVDIDGTTVDCEMRNRSVIEDVAISHGGKIEKDDWLVLAGTGDHIIHNFLKNKFPDFSVSCDQFVKDCHAGYLRRTFEVAARSGMEDVFAHIKEKKRALAAVTNAPREIAHANLTGAQCLIHMQFVLSATEVTDAGRLLKPAPDPYLMAAERLNVAPEDCLVFEDSKTGVKSGLAAGMTVIQIVDDPAFRHDDAHHHAYNAQDLRTLALKLVN